MIQKVKIVLFSVVVTAIFTLLVSGVNSALKEKTAINRMVAKQKVIVGLFGIATDTKNLQESLIPQLFADKIEPVQLPASASKKLEVYKLKNSQTGKFVFSFSGQGFWDQIYGFMAIDLEAQKIDGIEFTQHGETPGLGGRISEKEFKARFINKPINDIRSDGLRLKFMAEGTAKKTNEIDGITGATGTTVALEKIVNKSIDGFVALKIWGEKQ